MQLEGEGIKRILTGHRWRCLVPGLLQCWNQSLGWVAGGVCRAIARNLGIDSHIGWVKAAGQACSSLRPKGCDVILASGSPFVAFRLAKRWQIDWAVPMFWITVIPGREILMIFARHGLPAIQGRGEFAQRLCSSHHTFAFVGCCP